MTILPIQTDPNWDQGGNTANDSNATPAGVVSIGRKDNVAWPIINNNAETARFVPLAGDAPAALLVGTATNPNNEMLRVAQGTASNVATRNMVQFDLNSQFSAATGNNMAALFLWHAATATAASTGVVSGLSIGSSTSGAGSVATVRGIGIAAQAGSNVTNVYGLYADAGNDAGKTATYVVGVQGNVAVSGTTSGDARGGFFYANITAGGASSNVYGSVNWATSAATSTVGSLFGSYGRADVLATITGEAIGVRGWVATTASTTAPIVKAMSSVLVQNGASTDSYGIHNDLTVAASGTPGTLYGARTNITLNNTAAIVGNVYGQYIAIGGTGTAAVKYGTYIVGSGFDRSYIGGKFVTGSYDAAPGTGIGFLSIETMQTTGYIMLGSSDAAFDARAAATQYGAIRVNSGSLQWHNGTAWQTAGSGGGGSGWLLGGNTSGDASGTPVGISTVGRKDNVAWPVVSNNIEVARFASSGQSGSGVAALLVGATTAPAAATAPLYVTNTTGGVTPFGAYAETAVAAATTSAAGLYGKLTSGVAFAGIVTAVRGDAIGTVAISGGATSGINGGHFTVDQQANASPQINGVYAVAQASGTGTSTSQLAGVRAFVNVTGTNTQQAIAGVHSLITDVATTTTTSAQRGFYSNITYRGTVGGVKGIETDIISTAGAVPTAPIYGAFFNNSYSSSTSVAMAGIWARAATTITGRPTTVYGADIAATLSASSIASADVVGVRGTGQSTGGTSVGLAGGEFIVSNVNNQSHATVPTTALKLQADTSGANSQQPAGLALIYGVLTHASTHATAVPVYGANLTLTNNQKATTANAFRAVMTNTAASVQTDLNGVQIVLTNSSTTTTNARAYHSTVSNATGASATALRGFGGGITNDGAVTGNFNGFSYGVTNNGTNAGTTMGVHILLVAAATSTQSAAYGYNADITYASASISPVRGFRTVMVISGTGRPSTVYGIANAVTIDALAIATGTAAGSNSAITNNGAVNDLYGGEFSVANNAVVTNAAVGVTSAATSSTANGLSSSLMSYFGTTTHSSTHATAIPVYGASLYASNNANATIAAGLASTVSSSTGSVQSFLVGNIADVTHQSTTTATVYGDQVILTAAVGSVLSNNSAGRLTTVNYNGTGVGSTLYGQFASVTTAAAATMTALHGNTSAVTDNATVTHTGVGIGSDYSQAAGALCSTLSGIRSTVATSGTVSGLTRGMLSQVTVNSQTNGAYAYDAIVNATSAGATTGEVTGYWGTITTSGTPSISGLSGMKLNVVHNSTSATAVPYNGMLVSATNNRQATTVYGVNSIVANAAGSTQSESLGVKSAVTHRATSAATTVASLYATLGNTATSVATTSTILRGFITNASTSVTGTFRGLWFTIDNNAGATATMLGQESVITNNGSALSNLQGIRSTVTNNSTVASAVYGAFIAVTTPNGSTHGNEVVGMRASVVTGSTSVQNARGALSSVTVSPSGKTNGTQGVSGLVSIQAGASITGDHVGAQGVLTSSGATTGNLIGGRLSVSALTGSTYNWMYGADVEVVQATAVTATSGHVGIRVNTPSVNFPTTTYGIWMQTGATGTSTHVGLAIDPTCRNYMAGALSVGHTAAPAGANLLSVNGSIESTQTTINAFSDARLKDIIGPAVVDGAKALDAITQLAAITTRFKFKGDNRPEQIGFIAQEVEEISAELVGKQKITWTLGTDVTEEEYDAEETVTTAVEGEDVYETHAVTKTRTIETPRTMELEDGRIIQGDMLQQYVYAAIAELARENALLKDRIAALEAR